MDEVTFPLCVDCKHHTLVPRISFHALLLYHDGCARPLNTTYNVVEGEMVVYCESTCVKERTDTHLCPWSKSNRCGKEGKFFTSKIPSNPIEPPTFTSAVHKSKFE